MTRLRSLLTSPALLACVLQCIAFGIPSLALSVTPAIEIVGDYRYAYHAPETLSEAKQTACLEALHQAISTTAAVRERTASLVDSKAFHNLVHTLAAQYVSGQQILEQSDKGRTVYCKVRADFHPEGVERVLLSQASTGGELAVDQNRALRILSTREEPDGTVVVVYQALKRLDWLSTAYQGTLRESADVMVEFYDDQGILLRSTRYPARKTTTGDDVMNPGEIGTLKIAKPLNTKTYRVWLVK